MGCRNGDHSPKMFDMVLDIFSNNIGSVYVFLGLSDNLCVTHYILLQDLGQQYSVNRHVINTRYHPRF